MAIPSFQGAQVGMALSNQMDVAQSNRAGTRNTNLNNRAKRLEIEEFILNSQRREAERSLGIDTAQSSQRTLPGQEAATIAQNKSLELESKEFQSKKSIVLRGMQQQVNTDIAERAIGSNKVLTAEAKLTLSNNITRLYREGQEEQTQLLGNAFSSVDDQESYDVVLKTLPKMGIDPIALGLGPKYNEQNKAKIKSYMQAAVLTLEARRKLNEISASITPPASKSLQAVTMNVKNPDGTFTKQEVYRNIDANSKDTYFDTDKKPINMPKGSYEATVGSTPTDAPPKLKGVAGEELAYIATTKAQLALIDKEMFNEDGSIDRWNLFKASIQVPFVSGKGLPWDESRSLAANLGSIMAQSLHIRSGKQTRVDEKADVYAQMMPTWFDDDNTILVKINVMKSLIHGTLDVYKEGPGGLQVFDLEATMLNGSRVIIINQARADAAANAKPESRSTKIPVPKGWGLTPGGNLYKKSGISE